MLVYCLRCAFSLPFINKPFQSHKPLSFFRLVPRRLSSVFLFYTFKMADSKQLTSTPVALLSSTDYRKPSNNRKIKIYISQKQAFLTFKNQYIYTVYTYIHTYIHTYIQSTVLSGHFS